MTQLSVSDGKLTIEVKGWDRLWALRSHLSIPLEDVVRVYADSQIAEPWWKGLRVAGTNLPGVLAAGTFYHHSQWVFWDVHNPEKVIVIELRHEHYAKLIVEVLRNTEWPVWTLVTKVVSPAWRTQRYKRGSHERRNRSRRMVPPIGPAARWPKRWE